MSVRETKVPAIPAIRDDNVKEVLAAIKATLEVREGYIGDPLDQLVTMRELVALNVAETGVPGATTQEGRPLPVGPVLVAPSLDYNPATDFTTPPRPTGLRASGGFASVFLEWDGAPYKNPGYTEIWRSQFDVLGSAVMVGTTVANVYADPVTVPTTYYYWVRFVSVSAVIGPYNSTSGTPATVALNVAELLPALQNEINNSQLFVDLGTRISVAETGINTLQQITSSSASQITTLSSVVGSNQSAIQIQSKVTDGLSAQYTVKIDVNGHVSGFGLASSAVNGTPTSAFIVRADRFAITGANDTSDPLGTLNPTNVPFVVLTTPTVIGGITYPAGVWIKTAFIADATISSAKIASLTADKITTGTLTAAISVTTGRISGGVNTSFSPGSSNFGTGYFLGNSGSTNQFYVGSFANHMLWNGTQLTVKGTVAATNATFQGLTVTDANGNVLLSSGGVTSTALAGAGLGNFAYANQITGVNISTYIAAGAISNAYIGNFIQSGNFNGVIDASGNITSNGSAGWAIGKGGKAVFQDIYARGNIQATSLNAATGTFSGTLTAADGTFTGLLTAAKINVGTTSSAVDFIDPNQPSVPLFSVASGFLAYTGDTGVSTLVSETCYDAKSGGSYDCSYYVFSGAPVTSSQLLFTTNSTSADINRRIKTGAVRFLVVASGTIDHYFTIWYRYTNASGTTGTWIPIAMATEPQSSYGSATVSATGVLGISLGQNVQFGFSATNTSGAYWNSGLREIRDGSISVLAFNF